MRSRNVPRSVPPQILRRRRLVAGAVAGTLLLAACGGGDEPAAGADAGTELPEAVDAGAGEAGVAADEVRPDGVSAPLGDTFADLAGPDVIATSNIGTNLLPDVVIDDLTNDRKVNFRNLVPQDKPILLWMYAPH